MEAGGQTNEEAGVGSPDSSFLFLISLRTESHRGVFSVQQTKQHKVKNETFGELWLCGADMGTMCL